MGVGQVIICLESDDGKSFVFLGEVIVGEWEGEAGGGGGGG